MSEVQLYHRKAIQALNLANDAEIHGFSEESKSNFQVAFDFERRAAYMLVSNIDAEPTRSVLFRSAATLAKRLGQFEEARRLIYQGLAGNPFHETVTELQDLLNDVNFEIAIKNSPASSFDSGYIDHLRNIAINLKIEPKDNRYSKAIALDYIIDFLKNIQKSYKNYFEVNYRKTYPIHGPEDKYERILTLAKQEAKTFCVDLQFQSFGVSISADIGMINLNDVFVRDFAGFKKKLFNDFKEEVLLSDLSSENFQYKMAEKYSPEEQSEIFTPIVDSLKEKSSYSVSLTDIGFRKEVRKYTPLTRETEMYYKGYTEKIPSKPEDVVLRRNVELVKGTKKLTITSENLDQATFKWPMSNQVVSESGQILYIIHSYEVLIFFEKKQFYINDDFFQIYLNNPDYDKIKISFIKELIDKFDTLSNNTDRSLDETELFERMKQNLIKGW